MYNIIRATNLQTLLFNLLFILFISAVLNNCTLNRSNDYLENGNNKKNQIQDKHVYEKRIKIADDLYRSGLENLKKKKFDNARMNFENVLIIIPGHKGAIDKLRNIPELKKEHRKRIVAAKIKTINKLYQQGCALYKAGRYGESVIKFEEVIKLDPANISARDYLEKAKKSMKH